MQQGKSQETSHFQEWVFKLIESLGVTPDLQSDPLGFQFESEGRMARVFPHEEPTLAIAEVEVCSMLRLDGGQVARAAAELMRINYDARFAHEWQAVFDDEDTLVLWRAIRMNETDLESVADILAEGVDRAAQLETVVESILAPTEAGSETSQSQAMGHIRA